MCRTALTFGGLDSNPSVSGVVNFHILTIQWLRLAHFYLSGELSVVHERAATPVDFPVVLSLRRNGERNAATDFPGSREPAVGHHSLVAFPLAKKF